MRFLALVLLASAAAAQPVFTDVFPAEEYAARRARVLAKIGNGAAIVQGTTERPGEQPLRQSNQFHYLCGVVEPRAILVIDGKTKRTTLFLNPRNERREQSAFGPGLYPGSAAVAETGVDAVLPRDEFKTALAAIAKDGRAIYTTFRPEVLGSASSSAKGQLTFRESVLAEGQGSQAGSLLWEDYTNIAIDRLTTALSGSSETA
jgi:Xaa-Pro aminopeptidase